MVAPPSKANQEAVKGGFMERITASTMSCYTAALYLGQVLMPTRSFKSAALLCIADGQTVP